MEYTEDAAYELWKIIKDVPQKIWQKIQKNACKTKL